MKKLLLEIIQKIPYIYFNLLNYILHIFLDLFYKKSTEASSSTSSANGAGIAIDKIQLFFAERCHISVIMFYFVIYNNAYLSVKPSVGIQNVTIWEIVRFRQFLSINIKM